MANLRSIKVGREEYSILRLENGELRLESNDDYLSINLSDELGSRR